MYSHRFFNYGLVTLAILLCATAHGQSGRRQPPKTIAAPVPTPTPEPVPTPNSVKKSELGFIVALDQRDSFAGYPFSFYDALEDGCARALTNGSSAIVTASQDEMSRADAVKAAKAQKTTYVVLLRLDSQAIGRAGSYDEIEVEYVVFAPVTGKILTTGRSYQNSNRKGPIVVGPSGRGSNNIQYREQLLRRAGEDAGSRILHALHIDIPTTAPGP
ncbi:MAG: hypothetical protein ABR555_10895 [Pyrinomonadaceae bacterium]